MEYFSSENTDKVPALPEHVSSRVKTIFEEGTPENTRKAYRKDLLYFKEWSKAVTDIDAVMPFQEPDIIKFITDHLMGLDPEVESVLMESGIKAKSGPHSISTITRRIASISSAHEMRGLTNPCKSGEVRFLLSKARRAAVNNGFRVTKKKAATLDILETMIKTCDNSIFGIRDRAVLLFAFASGGRRRSEISSACFEDLTRSDSTNNEGYSFIIRRSKTDQEGKGFTVPIIGRAAKALTDWLEISEVTEGQIFRRLSKSGKVLSDFSDRAVARIVKKRAELAGLDPSIFSGHSLRSGFITEGGRQGKNISDIMAMSGHKTVGVALSYYQAGNALSNPAAGLAG